MINAVRGSTEELPDFYRQFGEPVSVQTTDRLFAVMQPPFEVEPSSVCINIANPSIDKDLEGIIVSLMRPLTSIRSGLITGGRTGRDITLMRHVVEGNVGPRPLTEAVGYRVLSYLEAKRKEAERSGGRQAIRLFLSEVRS